MKSEQPDHTEVDTDNSVFSWFARNHVAANLLMMTLLVGGLVTALTMTVEIFPEIDPRTITVTVPYPGSTRMKSRKVLTDAWKKRLPGLKA